MIGLAVLALSGCAPAVVNGEAKCSQWNTATQAERDEYARGTRGTELSAICATPGFQHSTMTEVSEQLDAAAN
jgi:hypothetical protein